ncbi:MAG TPA: hypothetical protein VFV08_00685, partial [Puia sp.]|nr:hypothetical protein [Puia sp.]
MLFREIIGQDPVKHKLVGLVHQNRLSHALLFLGPEGSGALPLAISFAQFLVCEKRNAGKSSSSSNSLFEEPAQPNSSDLPMDSCGTCASCTKAGQLIHPDIHFSYPVIPKKSGDKPLSTDYIGEWREFIREFPYGNVFDWLQFIGAENK